MKTKRVEVGEGVKTKRNEAGRALAGTAVEQEGYVQNFCLNSRRHLTTIV